MVFKSMARNLIDTSIYSICLNCLGVDVDSIMACVILCDPDSVE